MGQFKRTARILQNLAPWSSFVSRSIFQVNFISVVLVLDKVILSLNVFSAIRTRDVTIFFKRESTHIILVDNIFLDVVPLTLEEVAHP